VDQPPILRIVFDIIFGKFTENLLNYYIIIQLGIFVILMISAWLVYPKRNHYSIFRCTMSYLGSPEENHNPRGWYLFSIALIWKMITDIPLMLYMYRHLSKFSIFAAYFSVLFYGITILSGIIVGLFPDKENEHQTGGNFFKDLRIGMVHNVAAVLSFGATIIANIAIGIFYIVHPYTRPFTQWIPALILFVTTVSGAIFSQVRWQFKLKQNKKLKPWPGNGWYSLPLWEWLVFFVAEGYIYWNLLII
jgi:hypothetical protein